nr:hypothetical protein BaRGS_025515 [Batillaria attramentaria]
MIQCLEGHPAEDLVVYYKGKQLKEDVPLAAIEDSITLEVDVCLRGGMVQEYLARAGQVRSQTPKVEPQEKKTGCAKSHMQYMYTYNRRLFNVVDMFGLRKGPNANS